MRVKAFFCDVDRSDLPTFFAIFNERKLEFRQTSLHLQIAHGGEVQQGGKVVIGNLHF